MKQNSVNNKRKSQTFFMMFGIVFLLSFSMMVSADVGNNNIPVNSGEVTESDIVDVDVSLSNNRGVIISTLEHVFRRTVEIGGLILWENEMITNPDFQMIVLPTSFIPSDYIGLRVGNLFEQSEDIILPGRTSTSNVWETKFVDGVTSGIDTLGGMNGVGEPTDLFNDIGQVYYDTGASIKTRWSGGSGDDAVVQCIDSSDNLIFQGSQGTFDFSCSQNCPDTQDVEDGFGISNVSFLRQLELRTECIDGVNFLGRSRFIIFSYDTGNELGVFTDWNNDFQYDLVETENVGFSTDSFEDNTLVIVEVDNVTMTDNFDIYVPTVALA